MFSVDFSHLRTHFSNVWGIFLRVGGKFLRKFSTSSVQFKEENPVCASETYARAYSSENSRVHVYDKKSVIYVTFTFCFVQVISCSSDLPLFECLKPISRYSDYGFLGKGKILKLREQQEKHTK